MGEGGGGECRAFLVGGGRYHTTKLPSPKILGGFRVLTLLNLLPYEALQFPWGECPQVAFHKSLSLASFWRSGV